MAKKTTHMNKRQKLKEIDNIPKYSHQPRSPAPKRRRTDFSVFSNSSSLCNSGYLLGQSSVQDGLSCATISSSADGQDNRKMMLELSSARSCKSQGQGDKLFSKFYKAPAMEAESVVHDAVIDLCGDRKLGKEIKDNEEILDISPKRTQVLEKIGVCLTPGKVIIEEKSLSINSANQGSDGHVLVQFYGNCHSAWVDPARDVSELEDSFEERCLNSSENFQDALKQALLQRKEHISSCREFLASPDRSNLSVQQDQLSGKWTSSTSSGLVTNLPKRGKEKRERKPKIHFDEVTFPLKSSRKIRRFKIMRYLGLIAPIGSPFS
ncbi:uncharacterized protein LOC123220325 isoform X2 [Mangifera indica]|uniref:uncharacterized protein LOC123220325 isoform X2 n=1 Tax=Mangifera indica TaxID=29780 RepID=UPI001CFA8A27|nr:uncharacterized protein LOC123220325 isoform X2 [Mangifera indica]